MAKIALLFRVWAGNMNCGTLLVRGSYHDYVTNKPEEKPVATLLSYKKLRLVRVV